MTTLPTLLGPWAAIVLALTTLSPTVSPPAGAEVRPQAPRSALQRAAAERAAAQRAAAQRPAAQPGAAQPGPAPSAHAPGAPSPRLDGRWSWPLSPQPDLVHPFVRPSTAYTQGHRGVDLRGVPGDEVTAVDAGTVSHVGVIAGRGTISVLHPSGIRSTYEPVAAAVAVGQAVARGERLGALTSAGSHCAPQACLHLGAVRDQVYVDPMTLLGARRVRLLPLQTGS